MDLLADSSGEDEGEEEKVIKINTKNNYAEKYDNWRQKEQLQKLKDKYGENFEEESDDSEESSDDSEAEELNEENEKEFFATLAALKKKDPKIYDDETEFFKKKSETSSESGSSKVKKEKKVTLADVERQVMLEKGGHFDEIEDQSLIYAKDFSYNDEMKNIKDSFKNALNDEEDDEVVLEKKPKTAEQKKKEDAEYKSWLAGQKSSISDPEIESKMSGLREFWNQDNLDEGEKFLKDFLLNKRFLEQEEDEQDPEYDLAAHDDDENLSEDEKTVEKMEEFEHKFNFRFEEPDEDFIKRYPRTIKGTLRKEEDKRSKKRKEVDERKKQEKQQKKEEIKMLKQSKKKEIMSKLAKLKKITGNDEMELDDEDIDGDFDPEKYDAKMREVFSKYDETAADGADLEKPSFSDLEDEEYDEDDETEDWDNWTGSGGGASGSQEPAHCEDEDFVMDCDYDASKEHQNELIESTKGRRKSRRKSKFAEAVETSTSKPVFDPNEKTFEEYVDEYYKLDCEDVIDDVHCRFQYRSVPVNDFGLSVEEILGAKDSELNAWASLRKTCQYRSEQEERKDLHVYKNKSRDDYLKKKIMPTLFEDAKPAEEEEEGHPDAEDAKEEVKPTKKKRNRKKRKQPAEEGEEDKEENAAKKPKTDENDEVTGSSTFSEISPSEIKADDKVDQGSGKNKKKKKPKKKTTGAQGVIQINKIAGIFEKSQKPANNSNTFKKSFKSTKQKKPEDSKSLSDERLKAYGVNPNKFKREKKKEFFKKAALETK